MKRMQLSPTIELAVESGDALEFKADVLILKHAGTFHGLDREVAEKLANYLPILTDAPLEPSQTLITGTHGFLATPKIIFVGTVPIFAFGYEEIRVFTRTALEALTTSLPDVENIALTLHGPGYGLDEAEAFRAEIAGLVDAIRESAHPRRLRRVTIIEMDVRRVERLERVLDEIPQWIQQHFLTSHVRRDVDGSSDGVIQPPADKVLPQKPHVFVAMPFATEMDDTFHYGIQNAVNAAGYLCERADLSSYTGNVMEWVKKRIAEATLVIADLSKANPNVYLEVGFAWGCDRPTVLIVQDTNSLRFDVRDQRCLVYTSIRDLEQKLREELQRLRDGLL